MILKKLNPKEIEKLVNVLNDYPCTAKATNSEKICSLNGETLNGESEFWIDAKSLLGMYALIRSGKTENINLVLDEFDSDEDMIELTKALSPFMATKR